MNQIIISAITGHNRLDTANGIAAAVHIGRQHKFSGVHERDWGGAQHIKAE